MRVIVCGSRDLTDRVRVRLAVRMLQGIAAALPADDRLVVVHGGARGADQLVGEAAADVGLTVESVPAQWQTHDRDGASAVPCRCGPDADTCVAAGVRRNQLMLDRGADLVVALPMGALAASRGTRDMTQRADAAGVPVAVLAGLLG